MQWAIILLAVVGAAQADEPAFGGKTVSAWSAILGKLTDARKQPDFRKATEALGKIGAAGADISVPALVEAWDRRPAKDDNREHIASALAAIGPAAKAAVPSLVKAVKGNEPGAGAAVFTLAKIGAQPETVVPALAAAMREKRENGDNVGRHAAVALASFGESGVDALVAGLESKDAGIRLAICDALRRKEVRKVAKSAVATLERVVIDDPVEDVRRSAAASAKAIKGG